MTKSSSNSKGLWHYLKKIPSISTLLFGLPTGGMSESEVITLTLINIMVYIPLFIAGLYSFAKIYEHIYPPSPQDVRQGNTASASVLKTYMRESSEFSTIFGKIWNSISFIFKPLLYVFTVFKNLAIWLYQNPFRTLMMIVLALYITGSFYFTSLYKTHYLLKKWSGYTNTIMITLGVLLGIAVFTLFIDIKPGDKGGSEKGYVAVVDFKKNEAGQSKWKTYKPAGLDKLEEKGNKARGSQYGQQAEINKIQQQLSSDKIKLSKLKAAWDAERANNPEKQYTEMNSGWNKGATHFKPYQKKKEEVNKLEDQIDQLNNKLKQLKGAVNAADKSSFFGKVWWMIKQSLGYYKSLLMLLVVVCTPLLILWIINHFSALSTTASIVIGVVSALVLLYLIYDEFRGKGDVNTDGWKVFGLGGDDLSRKKAAFERGKDQREAKAATTIQQKYRDQQYKKQYDDAKKALGEKITNNEKELGKLGAIIKVYQGKVDIGKGKQEIIIPGTMGGPPTRTGRDYATELKQKKTKKKALETKISELKYQNKSMTFPRWWKETEEKEKQRDRWFGGGGGEQSQLGGGNIIDIPQDNYAAAKKNAPDPLYTAVLQKIQYKNGNPTPSAADKKRATEITNDIQKNWKKTEIREPGTNKKIIRYEEPKKGGDSILTRIFKTILGIPWLIKDLICTICEFCGIRNPGGLLILLLIEVVIIILYFVIPLIPKFLYTHSVHKHDDLMERQSELADDKLIIEKDKYLNQLLDGVSIDWETVLSDGLYKANMEAALTEYLKERGYQSVKEGQQRKNIFGKMIAAITKTPLSLEAAVTYVQTNGPVIISLRNQIEMLNKARVDTTKKEKKEANIFKTTVLLDKPIYTDKQTTISNYKDLGDRVGTFNYNYAISAWFFIHEQPPSHRKANTEFTSILNYGNKPNILFKVETQTLRITVNDAIDKNRVIYETADFPFQKWNNVIINYNGGTLDIFINGKLVSSSTNIVPAMNYDAITTGANDGISGGVCNVTYFPAPLSLSKIKVFYKGLKNKNPPIV